MSNQSPTEFSFDLYPGLDSELDDAYRRNVEGGIATPDTAVSGLAAVVGNSLHDPDRLKVTPEVSDWVSEELLPSTLTGWMRYADKMGLDTIRTALDTQSIDEFIQPQNRAEAFSELFKAREDLIEADERTPNGDDVGESMHLVLIPWHSFRDNLDRLDEWMKEMRSTQGIASRDDYFDSSLLQALKDETPMYRSTKTPLGGIGNTPQQWVSAREYLNERIDSDGAWGVMLAQTSDDAGLRYLVEDTPDDERSPDALTDNGSYHFRVAGHYVDAMGIFEWLALTLQEDPSTLSSQDLSWLLANRLAVNGGPCVPGGYFDGGQVRSRLYRADNDDSDIRPRLAVMEGL
jgi:hypothetical protein